MRDQPACERLTETAEADVEESKAENCGVERQVGGHRRNVDRPQPKTEAEGQGCAGNSEARA